MLVVTIDVIDANTGKRETIHEISIINDGTGNRYFGNYDVRLQSKGKEDRTSYVRQHYRPHGALRLLHTALESESGVAIGEVRKV